MRVLQWIVERCRGRAAARETPVGLAPAYAELNWTGTAFEAATLSLDVMRVDHAQWTRELAAHDALFAKLGAKRPAALEAEREQLAARLAR